MSREHLTYFKVENFKRFDSLELADIGQFNLIVGDNNVGKTSVLEALLFDRDRIKCLGKLHKTLILKGIHLYPKRFFGTKGEVTDVDYPVENFLLYLSKNIAKLIRIEATIDGIEESVALGVAKIDQEDILEVEHAGSSKRFDNLRSFFLGRSADNRYISFFEEWKRSSMEGNDGEYSETIAGLYSHCLSQNPKEIALPLISVSLEANGTLSNSYFEYVRLSRQAKQNLIEEIKFLIPEIEDFEVRKIGGEDQLLVGVKRRDEMTPISTFGESVTRATQVLLEISKHKGKRLMIDEIDTGIHYSRMKNFLKTIFQVADKNDVQLFMTTHSLECQQAFAEVFEDADMVQHQAIVRQFSLLEKPDGQVVASCRDFEQLNSALETGYDTRGGKQVW
ncbi:MAG: AAA family ATPase [Saprospiraceae bacterium]